MRLCMRSSLRAAIPFVFFGVVFVDAAVVVFISINLPLSCFPDAVSHPKELFFSAYY